MLVTTLRVEYFLEIFIVIETNFKFTDSSDKSIRCCRSSEEVKDVNLKHITA